MDYIDQVLTVKSSFYRTELIDTNGADILRVHDVREARETINLYEIYENNAISI